MLSPLKHMPNASPIHEGTVSWEAKKGKWSKRHLRLREHSLFVSKKDSVSRRYCIKDSLIYCLPLKHRAKTRCIFAR